MSLKEGYERMCCEAFRNLKIGSAFKFDRLAQKRHNFGKAAKKMPGKVFRIFFWQL